MGKYVSEAAVLKRLEALIAVRGSQAAFAKDVGCSRQYVSMMLGGMMRISGDVLNYLGFERVEGLYRRKEPKDAD